MSAIYAGIDAGSRAVKIALWDADKQEIVTTGIEDQGIDQEGRAGKLLERLLSRVNLSREKIGKIIATGYGRNLIGFADSIITEISCHARGVRHFIPDAGTIIDIGGQDSKVIHVDEKGNVRDFALNDRCAAGTGSFLEMVARRLEKDLKKLGELALESKKPAPISNMCVVFAETEIIGLLARAVSPPDIAAGVQASIASRIEILAGRAVRPPVIFTGGVALIPGMSQALEAALKVPVRIPPNPQLTGALGAALLAG